MFQHQVIKFQMTSTKLQINLKIQYSMTEMFEILNFGHCDLPFEVAQGGEPVEPFVICDL
jgi:hypothetical protein